MLAQMIEEFTAALCWARTARAYIAVTRVVGKRPKLGMALQPAIGL